MALNLIQTETAIKLCKDTFERRLSGALGLTRVSAPLFVDPATGLNDNLSGKERPVAFDVPHLETSAEIVQSLAKWKRMALGRYGFTAGTGLYTDMNAIRRDEQLDALHSIYVDQWDWELVITHDDRKLETLKNAVTRIYSAILQTEELLCEVFPALKCGLAREITFITSQELEDMYPDVGGSERENLFLERAGAAFIIGIGGKLKSGQPHDMRAPDYDDWTLNGDICVWNPALKRSFELSSMGIRVDAAAMRQQLELSGHPERAELEFHKGVLENRLPLTMGGGIGQSRLCMLLLNKAHIGEVQSSLWPKEHTAECEKAGIILL